MIFALNFIVGFACSLGVDMGFNTAHHEEPQAVITHFHSDGSKHQHKQQKHNQEEKSHKDNCCTNEAAKVAQADKISPSSFQLINPVFFTSFLSVFYQIDLTDFSQNDIANKYFVRGYHPPIPDIRIAIQSFQI